MTWLTVTESLCHMTMDMFQVHNGTIEIIAFVVVSLLADHYC
jgi:hypothetical protein